MKLPIIDPLGILKKPAEDALRSLGVDVELSDPFREFTLGLVDGLQDEVEAESGDDVGKQPTDSGAHREAYLDFGKRVITFDCTRCQAIAEQVAAEYAPASPKRQLECMYYIKMFDENDVGEDGYETAKKWLEEHDLKDVLYAAYLTELGVGG
jgi:broad specificity phosphatase PhoE